MPIKSLGFIIYLLFARIVAVIIRKIIRQIQYGKKKEKTIFEKYQISKTFAKLSTWL